MQHAVVLEHTLPDGSRHFDWMIERPDTAVERRLCTWRTEVRPDRSDRFGGQRIDDHRAVYLRFEGELGAGRGCVVRVASGRAEWIRQDAGSICVTISWQSGQFARYEGDIGADGRWRFVRSAD